MARFSRTQFGLLVLACWTCSTCALSLEQKLQTLTEKFEIVEAKVHHLEDENGRLKETLTQLKNKIGQQDSILTDLLQNRRQTNEEPKLISENSVIENPPNGKSAAIRAAMPRTCREARTSNPALTSGMYWIDPDGQGVGDDPISVYCNMTSGSTSVLHNSESPMDVGHCSDPGCYSREIKYDASTRQMAALAELSNECHQSIKYDCTSAPFEVNGVAYSWWNDRTGKAKYFWSGSNSSVHVCQCGIDHNCVEAFMPCNCDSGLPAPLTDDGVITDKNILPITQLNFGRTILESSSGVHTLGRFECTGQVVVSGMPSSCEDLWQIGHTLSGLYSVMGTTKVESIYCDFTKLPTDTGFQKWIGYANVKSVPTYFYVQRNTNFSPNATNPVIPFETAKVNIGNAFSLSTGIFTAPRAGTYFFSFIGLSQFPASSSVIGMSVYLFVGSTRYGAGLLEESSPSSGQNDQVSVQATISLKAGDKVSVQISSFSAGMYLLESSSYHYTHFSGWLLEEDFALS